jgi:transcription initiation factor TFIIB
MGASEPDSDTNLNPELGLPDGSDVISVCPDCGSKNFIFDPTGEVTCSRCGVVISERSVVSTQLRAYTMEEELAKRRTYPMRKTDFGSSTFPSKPVDKDGKLLSREKRYDFYRRKKQDMHAVNESLNRNLSVAVPFVDRICTELGLNQTQIKSETIALYRKVHKEGFVKGRVIEGSVAACLYMVCRNMGIARRLDEIAEAANKSTEITTKQLARLYREIYWIFDGEVEKRRIEPVIARALNKLETEGVISPRERTEMEKKSIKIYKQLEEARETAGKDPSTLAAGIIYFTSRESGSKIPQRIIAHTCKTTEVSLRNRLRDIEGVITPKS